MENFLRTLGFKPDEFQLEAMVAINDGHSVVVCSPTGSGKTLVAEYAAFKAIEEGRKIFYTTPLKALSNQKFNDFKKTYGEDKVGLLTGDISINRDAQIVIMTTEVFRNMLYGIHEDSRLLRAVSGVVLDECHFMNDAQRGTVWEESIIYCPDSIQIIALSATVANALELTDWINEVHHNTVLVSSDFRPVPLRFSYFTREELVPLFKPGTNQVNPKLKFDNQGKRLPKHLRAFDPNKLINELHQREMLPAIFFTFSRKGCDKYLFETRNLNLLTPAEKQRLREKIDAYVAEHPFLENSRYLAPMRNGFASHHAGLLPALKGLVEHLFQQGLIKVVFATETLAAGINMPARTTVITSISKRSDDGHRILTASEFLQMSGRAGRRGMDDVGYVVTVSSPYESAYDTALLASSAADPLNSRFTPTYGMVLNLLQKHTLKEAEYLISKSFGSFTADRRIQPLKEEIDTVAAQWYEANTFECPHGLAEKDFQNYLRSKEMLKESYRVLKLYKQQMKRYGKSKDIIAALAQEEGKKDSLNKTVSNVACATCDIYKQHLTLSDRKARLQKRLKQLHYQFEQEDNTYWKQFSNHYNLLKEVGFLDEDNMPTEPGKLTGEIRAENEFYIAQVILAGLLEDLPPAPLAGLMCAVVNDSNRENLFSRLPLSPMTRHALNEVQQIGKQVHKLQKKHHLDTPTVMNPVASGLVEAWVEGARWDTLIRSTNIDEGDLVRIIRRTADMLRQLSRNTHLPTTVSDTATLALKGLYRDPIKENDNPQAEKETAENTNDDNVVVLPGMRPEDAHDEEEVEELL